MTNQIEVNNIAEEEKETVRSLLVESYKQYEPEYSDPQVWREYLEDITSSVDNPEVEEILVAKINGHIVGSLQVFDSFKKAYNKPEPKIFAPIIRYLGVHPKARGLGVAQKLLTAGINHAKEQSANNLYLFTSDQMKKAVRLYERYGFIRDQNKEYYHYDILVKCYRYNL